MSGGLRLRVVLLLALASGACASIEGLTDFSQCTDNCGDGMDATTPPAEAGGAEASGTDTATPGQDAPAVGDDAENDAPVLPEDATDSGAGQNDGATSDSAADSPADADAALDSTTDAPVDGPGDGSSPVDVFVPPDSPLPDGTIPDCAAPPDDNAGVFVTPGGADILEGGVCGLSRSTPCKTIGAGLSSASTAAGRSIVYVAAGTYTEKLTLVNGVTVQGGWHVGGDGGTEWTYDCTSPSTVVTVQAPANTNTTVVANSGAATLTTLTIVSKASASSGQSLYGIMATGASTSLTLNDVVVSVAAAGDGATGSTGGAGSTPPGTCSTGDGASATTGGTAGTTANPGSFALAGFTPGAGGVGGAGSPGDNGTAGATGATTSYGSCMPVALNCTSTTSNCVGGTGKPGCGGGGGLGGAGGGGGGSSVALYVYGAHVTVNGGSFTAGNGGKGGPGGGGGSGASGSNGATGTTTTCTITVCGNPIPAICQGALPGNPLTVSATGGAAGGTGGNGSNGGPGGGGAGGDSFALVTAGSGGVVFNGAPSLAFGSAGTGSGGGATGAHGTYGQF